RNWGQGHWEKSLAASLERLSRLETSSHAKEAKAEALASRQLEEVTAVHSQVATCQAEAEEIKKEQATLGRRLAPLEELPSLVESLRSTSELQGEELRELRELRQLPPQLETLRRALGVELSTLAERLSRLPETGEVKVRQTRTQR
ncbi:unnamed protein product, partial [Durusdinium trenchii]